jgi:hypothetical protein
MRSFNQSVWLGCLLVCGASVASAQTSVDRSFTVDSKSCEGIQWSSEALEMYPTIESACQAVEERDGKTYVKFEGKVKRNVDRGKQLVVDFKDGGEVTLRPPPEMHVYLDGRRTPAAKLQSGDELNFYVPEDRFAAHFPETETVTTRFVVVPMVQPQQTVAEQPSERMAALPATAGWMPLLALLGLTTIGTGVVLTCVRRRVR